MDQKTLSERLSAQLELPASDIAKLNAALVDVLADTCGELGSVALPGFGVFEGRKRTERVTVHPSSGKRLLIPPKIQISFRPSALLKQKIKGE